MLLLLERNVVPYEGNTPALHQRPRTSRRSILGPDDAPVATTYNDTFDAENSRHVCIILAAPIADAALALHGA